MTQNLELDLSDQLAGRRFILGRMEIIIQVAGWIGTVLIVLAYFLVSNKKVDSASAIYQWINLFGAIGVGINVFYQRTWPAVALQITWGIIAIVALVKSRK